MVLKILNYLLMINHHQIHFEKFLPLIFLKRSSY